MGWLDAHLGHVKLTRYADKYKFQAWEESASDGVKSNCTVRKLTPEELAALPALFAKDTYWRFNGKKKGRTLTIGSFEETKRRKRILDRLKAKKAEADAHDGNP